MNGARFRFPCRYCRRVVLAAEPRLTDDALAVLRDHVRRAHPDVELIADAGAGAVLRHFDVEPVS
jgi:putative lipoic acid-binding regulatory protein